MFESAHITVYITVSMIKDKKECNSDVQMIAILTQHWAIRQSLSSEKSQTFQSVAVALVHHLLWPNEDRVDMSAVKVST